MSTNIAETLAGVPSLNQPGQPFFYTAEGTSIVGRWKWQDQTLFAPAAVTDEVREFTFIVDLNQDGTYKERTQESSTTTKAGLGGVSMEKTGFIGNSSKKSFSISIGKDKNTGDVGVVKASLDTDLIKRPLRDYLARGGWKQKGGLFSKLFG